MKKVIYSLAVVTLAAIMVSCSGNSSSESEDTNSVIVEVEEPAEQTVDARDFTLVMPEDWVIEDMASSFLKIKKDMPNSLPKQLWFFPYPKTNFTAFEKVRRKIVHEENVMKTPVKIAHKLCYVLYKESDGDNSEYYDYYVDMPDSGFFNIRALNGYNTKDPEIKEILESIKFK